MEKRDLQIEQLKQKLLAQQAELTMLNNANEMTKPVVLDQSSVGRLSRMDAMQGQQMALETQRRNHVLLQKIDSALRRIANDEYGYCLDCGEEIYLRRLAIEPTTLFCIQCAGKRV
jgi:DnaK suppressor protein